MQVFRRRDARCLPPSNALAGPVGAGALGDPNAVKCITLDPAVVDTWLFDPPGALGQLWSATRQINAVLEKRSTYTYDTLARPTRRSSQQNQGGGVTQTFVTDTVYDGNYGRPKQLIHPSGDSVWLRYTKYGQLNQESDFPNTQDYRRITAVTERGQSQTEYLGAALTASYAYTGNTGQMTSAIYTKAGSTVRQLGYQYDVFGNVTKQELGTSASTTETYAYDKLMRLKSATRAGGVVGAVTYDYDGVGNFRYKSDYSTTIADAYVYTGGSCGGGPNAVKRITLAPAVGGGTRTMCYDPNGNLTGFTTTAGGNGEVFAARYDHDNLPYRTERGGFTVDLTYDADGARVRQSGADGTRLYDGAYEKLLSPAVEHKIYLGDYAVLTRPVGGLLRVNYLLKDRLGSVDAVTDSSGTLVETRGSDAFGKPRQGTWADANPPKLGTIANTPRGFTQHEHLNAVALIHMNGRAYDYQLGRFLSVDAVIQFPTNSQSLNPYSYILNNPLSGTDPSGYATCFGTPAEGESCTETVTQLGSHISKTYTVVGGASSVSVYGGASNGATTGASSTGAGGRKNQGSPTQSKGAIANADATPLHPGLDKKLDELGPARGRYERMCAGYSAAGSCTPTSKLFGVIDKPDGVGQPDSQNAALASSGHVRVSEDGMVHAEIVYDTRTMSKGRAIAIADDVSTQMSQYGDAVNMRRAGKGESPNLTLVGAGLKELAARTQLCDCLAAMLIGGYADRQRGEILINTVSPFSFLPYTGPHEVGHYLGRSHQDSGIMSYRKDRTYTPEDAAALRRLYDN